MYYFASLKANVMKKQLTITSLSGHMLYIIFTLSNPHLLVCPTLLSPAPEIKEKYSYRSPPYFQMKYEPNKFNHVVIQNTITTHT